MANYSKKSKKGRIVAGVLCGVLAVAAVAGAGTSLYMGIKNDGWFSKTVEQENEDENAEAFVVSPENTNSPITLSAKLLSASEGEEGTASLLGATKSSYLVTASWNSDATTPTFIWSVDGDSDYDYVYISPSSDTYSCTVSRSTIFSGDLKLVCTDSLTGLSASCSLYSVCGISAGTMSFSEGGSSDGDVDPFSVTKGGTGTVYTNAGSNIWINTSTYTFDMTCALSYGTGNYKESVSSYSYVVSSSIVSGSSKTYTSYRSSITVNDLINIATGKTLSSSTAGSIYTTLKSYYDSSTPVITVTATMTGAMTCNTCTGTYNLLINPVGLVTFVTSLSLDYSSVYFY